MGELHGFGFTLDVRSGVSRGWYVGKDGVRRWAHNDEPVDDVRYTITDKGRKMLREAEGQKE